MAGSLLVSGNPQHYKAIGEGGQPVYAVAFQLREAIRLKAGIDTANCLAIPQSNQHGSMVDWYSPTEGEVVPWSAATSQEREYALSKLDAAHRSLNRVIASMEQTPARDSQAEREKNTVLPLMGKVFHFPDSNFIYLVNGEPVVAFWGFHSEGSILPADPFLSLRPVQSQIPSQSVPPPTEPVQAKRAWWWWLLLLLLLLLLLFFLLRACAPSILPSAVQQPQPTAPVTRPIGTGTQTAPLSNQGTESFVDRGVSVLRRWWPGTGGSVDIAAPNATTPEAVVPTLVEPSTVAPDAPTPNSAEANAVEPNSAAIDPSAPNTATPGVNAPEGTTPAATDVSNPQNNAQPNAEAPNTGEPPAPVSPQTGNPTNPANPSSAQQGRPMTIPQQAIQSGNTRFLNGSWTAGTGIQDAKTGKPLRMEYDFSQGNGQGKVTIRRADGSQCVGSVSAQMQSRNLQISDQGVAKCSDGSTMALPKVTCTPQADGRANCQGRYENGTTFPVSMRHSPK